MAEVIDEAGTHEGRQADDHPDVALQKLGLGRKTLYRYIDEVHKGCDQNAHDQRAAVMHVISKHIPEQLADDRDGGVDHRHRFIASMRLYGKLIQLRRRSILERPVRGTVDQLILRG